MMERLRQDVINALFPLLHTWHMAVGAQTSPEADETIITAIDAIGLAINTYGIDHSIVIVPEDYYDEGCYRPEIEQGSFDVAYLPLYFAEAGGD